jgi:signal peptide peptidase SppA
MTLLDELLAGRTLALDRSALPTLATTAELRAAGASLDQLAQRTDLQPHDVAVQHVGSTAIVPLTGLITSNPLLAFLAGGTMPDALVASLRQAVADPDVREILLLVDSPGGEVALMTETASEIRRLRDITPITAIARPLMASAAFWLAAQATDVVATPSADIGSVGVFAIHIDQSKRNEQAGIRPTYITSSAEKVEGNPDAPLSEQAIANMKQRVDETTNQFVSDLAAGRGTSVATVRSRFGSGRMFAAAEALGRGMVDRIETSENTLGRLATTTGRLRASTHRLSRSAVSDAEQAALDEQAILAVLSADAS